MVTHVTPSRKMPFYFVSWLSKSVVNLVFLSSRGLLTYGFDVIMT